MSYGVSANAQIPQYVNVGGSAYRTSGQVYGTNTAQPSMSPNNPNIRTSNYAPPMPNLNPPNSYQSSYKPVPENRPNYNAHYVPAPNTYQIDKSSQAYHQSYGNQSQPPVLRSSGNQSQFADYKGSSFPYICWALLGLLAIAGLVLGVLFGIGVLGKSDTVLYKKPYFNNSTIKTSKTIVNTTTTSTTTGVPQPSTTWTGTQNLRTTTTLPNAQNTVTPNLSHKSSHPISHMRKFSQSTI